MRDVEFKEADHSIFDLLNWIREKPNAFLDGECSIRRLRSFLVGYECGMGRLHVALRESAVFREFNDWVAKELGYAEPTSGWCNMILAKTASEEEAFSKFFELLDGFLKETQKKK